MKAKYKDKKQLLITGRALVPSNHWNHCSYAPHRDPTAPDTHSPDLVSYDCHVVEMLTDIN
jgi:hypothetical protein